MPKGFCVPKENTPWNATSAAMTLNDALKFIPHHSLAAAALVVALDATNVDVAHSLNETPPPANAAAAHAADFVAADATALAAIITCFAAPFVPAALASSQMRAADDVPQWLVGRYRPLCTNVLAAARRAS